MCNMFFRCSLLEDLNLSNFVTKNVVNISFMFCGCPLLKEINISNFIINNTMDTSYMFFGCSKELKSNIKAQNKNIKDKAF